MKEFIQVPKDIVLYAFLDWYWENIGKYKCESMMVADRINYFNMDRQVIAYISVYFTNEYFISKEQYDLWVSE